MIDGDPPIGEYLIPIDKNWDLEDLYKFPRAYEQVYFAYYSLIPHDNEFIQSRIDRAYSTFPWQGGYSAVNFYNHLKHTIPRRERPKIKSIQYASPGWIELFMIAVPVTLAVSMVVRHICSSIDAVNNTYNAIHRGLSERKLLRIETERREVELLKENRLFVREACVEMAEWLKVPIDQLPSIHERTGSELKTLKIFLSVFRRLKILADYHRKGKAKL